MEPGPLGEARGRLEKHAGAVGVREARLPRRPCAARCGAGRRRTGRAGTRCRSPSCPGSRGRETARSQSGRRPAPRWTAPRIDPPFAMGAKSVEVGEQPTAPVTAASELNAKRKLPPPGGRAIACGHAAIHRSDVEPVVQVGPVRFGHAVLLQRVLIARPGAVLEVLVGLLPPSNDAARSRRAAQLQAKASFERHASSKSSRGSPSNMPVVAVTSPQSWANGTLLQPLSQDSTSLGPKGGRDHLRRWQLQEEGSVAPAPEKSS